MALLFTILCGAAALCLGYFITYFARGHVVQSAVDVLRSETRYLDALPPHEPLPVNPARLYEAVPGNNAYKITPLGEQIVLVKIAAKGQSFAAQNHTLPDGRQFLVGYDVTDIVHDFGFMQALGAVSIIFVMIVVFVSYLISIFVVNGTNKIADTARQIIHTGDLSRRVDMGSKWDDLGNMASVLNLLLTRIEELMQGVRQVSDNIAHDLRTPLTRMHNRIEDLRVKTPSADHDELLAEAERLLTTFNALLRISRIETEKQKVRFQDVDLKIVISDVYAFYEPLADERQITLRCDLGTAHLHGDRDLLFQACANILDNAIKFTPRGGAIDIRLETPYGRHIFTVTDNGPGVPEDELDKIFDRFYRVEKSRSTPGTGLGLSLVEAIINLHGGTIRAENIPGGFRIVTIL